MGNRREKVGLTYLPHHPKKRNEMAEKRKNWGENKEKKVLQKLTGSHLLNVIMGFRSFPVMWD